VPHEISLTAPPSRAKREVLLTSVWPSHYFLAQNELFLAARTPACTYNRVRDKSQPANFTTNLDLPPKTEKMSGFRGGRGGSGGRGGGGFGGRGTFFAILLSLSRPLLTHFLQAAVADSLPTLVLRTLFRVRFFSRQLALRCD
jgi:hypothetical protein